MPPVEAPRCRSWSGVATEGPADEHDPVRVDLGLAHHQIHHPGHHVLPVGTHRHPTLVQRNAGSRAVEGDVGPAPVEGMERRGIHLFGGPVVATQVEDGGERAVALRREEIAGGLAVEDHCRTVEQRQCLVERGHAGGVGGGELGAVEVVAVPEEGLPEVLGRAQEAAAGAHGPTGSEGGIPLRVELLGEAGPRPEPTVAVTGCDP